jgi:hypothetical protein
VAVCDLCGASVQYCSGLCVQLAVGLFSPRNAPIDVEVVSNRSKSKLSLDWLFLEQSAVAYLLRWSSPTSRMGTTQAVKHYLTQITFLNPTVGTPPRKSAVV